MGVYYEKYVYLHRDTPKNMRYVAGKIYLFVC